ncbi:MAG: hypothetical protein GF398_06485 [Chitinivibrionales bacterium]|nr:hypothetical protein [Chitinivibrionales bacterium]
MISRSIRHRTPLIRQPAGRCQRLLLSRMPDGFCPIFPALPFFWDWYCTLHSCWYAVRTAQQNSEYTGQVIMKLRSILVILVLTTGVLHARIDKDIIVDLSEFSRMIVRDKGRLKPMETYAKSTLLQFTSRTTIRRKISAVQWLATVMFDPAQALDEKIFRINHHEVVDALGIEPEDKFRYSYTQLFPALSRLHNLAVTADNIERDKRKIAENELLRLYTNVTHFMRIMQSFSFAQPAPEFTIENKKLKQRLGLSTDQTHFTYLNLIDKAKNLLEAMQPESTVSDSSLTFAAFGLANSMKGWSEQSSALPPSLFPVTMRGQEAPEWQSPWKVLNTQHLASTWSDEIMALARASDAFRRGDQQQFDEELRAVNKKVAAAAGADVVGNISTELRYNKLNAFYRSKIFYVLALVLAFVSLLIFHKVLDWASLAMSIIAWLFNVTGIVLRMLITGRPPITNLFETFVFVSAAGVLLALILRFVSKNRLMSLIPPICGFAMMMISGRYSSEGDTMNVVMAVLDSNFWLATHVVTITLGYAGMVVAGVIGHIYLVQNAFPAANSLETKSSTYRMIYGALAFGLIFTFLGTVLGGIWADQSWGRFWGWDPKENGALLIVLWGAVIFHAKLGGMVKDIGVAAGSVIGVIFVMLAWFGVNLLGIGLHSYGFTTGAARALFIFILFELLFAGAFSWLAAVKQSTPPQSTTPIR